MTNYLTDDEVTALGAYEGCACCRVRAGVDSLWPDDCPRVLEFDEEEVQHSYEGDCNQNLTVLVERVIAAKVAEATP